MRIAGIIYGAGRPPFEGTIAVEKGSIVAAQEGVLPGNDLVDLRPARLVPGFIDLHIHGGGGWEAGDLAPGATAGLARFLATQGTTAFHASLPPAPDPRWEASIAGLARDCQEEIKGGARLLGIHLEGPFLNPRKKGAMNPELLTPPDHAKMERWLALGAGWIRQVTLAPEHPGALEMTRMLVGQGITVTGGHTDATADETQAGIEAGVHVANHIYNAMRALDHRNPGPIAAYLLDPRVTCEMICDCLHLHPLAMRLVLAAKGVDRVSVISDSGPFSGLEPGEYMAHGIWHVLVHEDGSCRLPDGTLAGSTFHQVAGVRNLVLRLGLDLSDAVHMAATVPARLAGLSGQKGRLLPGYDADIVALDDQYRVLLTLVEGETAYRSDETGSRVNPAVRPTTSRLQEGICHDSLA